MIIQVDKKLETLPQGTVRVSTSHDTYQYYVESKYASQKNRGLLETLALREYYEKLKHYIEEVLPKLEALITVYELQRLDAPYNNLPMGKKVLDKDSYVDIDTKEMELIEGTKLHTKNIL